MRRPSPLVVLLGLAVMLARFTSPATPVTKRPRPAPPAAIATGASPAHRAATIAGKASPCPVSRRTGEGATTAMSLAHATPRADVIPLPAPATTDGPSIHWSTTAPVSPESELLLDLRLGRESTGLVRGHLRGDAIYLPLVAIYRAAGYQVQAGDRGWTIPVGDARGARLVLARDGGLTGGQGGTLPLWVGPDGQPYLPVASLAALLDTPVSVDLERAIAVVPPEQRFPAMRARQREAVHAALTARAAKETDASIPWAETADARGVTLDYRVSAGLRKMDPARYDLGLAVPALGGLLGARWQGARDSRLAPAELSWSFLGRPGSLVSQMQIGDGAGSGPRPARQRGIMLTNAPLWRPLVVEAMPFQGELPPGWSVDAFRAGQLLAFDSVDGGGRFRVTLPLNRGENPVDFHAYGPDGEVATFRKMFRSVPQLLPRGATEYGLSAGRCVADACRWNGDADLRAGVSRAVTLRAGVQHQGWRDSARTLPYAGILVAPRGAVSFEAEHATRTLSHAMLRIEPDAALRVTVDATRLAPTALAGARSDTWISAHVVPGGVGGGVALEALASRRSDGVRRHHELQVGAVLTREGVQVRPSLHWQATGTGASETSMAIETTLQPRTAIGAALGGTWLRAQAEGTLGGALTAAALTAVRGVGGSMHLDAAARWNRSRPGVQLSVGLQADLTALRTITRATAGRAGAVEQSVEGSIRWDEGSRRLSLSASPGTQKTGILAELFLDGNGDGIRQASEPPVVGARVIIGGQLLVSDSGGRVRSWGMQAWEPVTIVVDTASLASPRWIPSHGALLVAPKPDRMAVVALPIVEGVTIEGRVELDPDLALGGGVLPLVLRNLATQELLHPDVFADGTFYLAAVKPGAYALQVEEASRIALHLAAAPLLVDVQRDAAGGAARRPLAFAVSRDVAAEPPPVRTAPTGPGTTPRP